MDDLISRQAAIDAHCELCVDRDKCNCDICPDVEVFRLLPSAQSEYEPVTAEDFAKTMSASTIYSFMAWHHEALELMKRQGFVICKKTM